MDYEKSLNIIEGLEMSSVEFVRDYVQLKFDGPVITAYSYPLILHQQQIYNSSMHGYKDVLCSLIGKRVTTIKIEQEKEINISFEEDYNLKLLLFISNYDGVEYAMFNDGQGNLTVW